jgi:hypothetical protein
MMKLTVILRNTTLVLFMMAVALCAQAAAQKDVMLVLDNSGSMRKNDPKFLAKGAVSDFINGLDSNYRAGIIIFDENVKQAIPLMPVDDQTKSELVKSLDNINYRGQLTDSPAAVERAIYELKTHPREGAEQFIIFMTDGIVDTGKPEADVEKTKWLREELAVDAADNNIKVYAIAFTEHADFFLIQSLAKKSGGEYFRAVSPDDLTRVFSSVTELLNAEPPVVEPVPKPVDVTTAPSDGPTVTPLPDEDVNAEPLSDQASPEDLLAVLTPDERLALEEIAAETGIPIEQLAEELLGPEEQASEDLLATLTPDERLALEEIAAETGIPIEQLAEELLGPDDQPSYDPQREPPGTEKIEFPDDESIPQGDSQSVLGLALAAGILLALVALVVWFVRRRRTSGGQLNSSSSGAEAQSGNDIATGAADDGGIPEAYINDVNGYTGDPAIRLGEKPMMVGRVAGNDTDHLDYLVVNKGTVGRRHAVIKFKDYSFWVVDQGSVNGTFVNGERISGEQQLKHGDKVRFHKYDFEFSQPDMDDGFHTVFADPDAAQATIVADAATIVASAKEIAAQIDEAGGAAAGGMDGFDNDVNDMAEPAAAFADADIFDISSENDASGLATGTAAAPSEASQLETATFEAPPDVETATDEDEEQDEDDEDLGVEINLDTVGAEDHPSLVFDSPPLQKPEDFDADASAFFEDITVGPTPDDDMEPALDDVGDGMFDDDSQSDLDDKLERASALLDADDSLETAAGQNVPKLDGPNDRTLEEFMETDSFDAPATVPPAVPKTVSTEDEGDNVTLEAFMSTSVFDDGKVSLTNEDPTILPFEVPDEPNAGMDPGDTVKLPGAPKFDKKDDDDSEDPTVLR